MIFYQHLINVVLASCFAIISWLALAPNVIAIAGKPLPLNQPAPEFRLPTNTGDGSISLSDFPDKWVVLYFYIFIPKILHLATLLKHSISNKIYLSI